jgi:hypothetical protein
MSVKKSDLNDQILTDDGSFLYCQNCRAEYSANSGDYFMLADDHVFKCECGDYMVLATKATRYNIIK